MPKVNNSQNRQSGIVALFVVMVLLLVALLGAVGAHRGFNTAAHSALHQQNAAHALEAAQAGIDWGAAMLNAGRLDINCMASSVNTDQTIRQRHFAFDVTTARYQTRHTPDQAARSAVCLMTDATLSCHCPQLSDLPQLAPPQDGRAVNAFGIELKPGSHAGTVRLISHGCANSWERCGLSQAPQQIGDGYARIEALLTMVTPQLQAALTVFGDVDAVGSLGAHNSSPQGLGLTINSAGEVSGASPSRLSSAPGTIGLHSINMRDPYLQSLRDNPEQAFQAIMNQPLNNYPLQAGVKTISAAQCQPANCGALLQAAYDEGYRAYWIDGPVSVAQDFSLGTVQDPITWVVNGPLKLSGSKHIYGLVYVIGDLRWDAVEPGTGQVFGATVVHGNVSGGAADYAFDADILSRRNLMVRVAGSWIVR